MSVRAKKHLGQHFIKDKTVCADIADSIITKNVKRILEVGPGTGALTEYLLKKEDFETHVIEVDTESINYLHENFPALNGRIYERDFLRIDLQDIMGEEPFIVAGNFPYNISTQILFKVLEYKNQVPEVVGMFQKEVAERIAEGPGSKKYGIISVLLQAYYDIEYLFTVEPHVFVPPPKVRSGVIRLVRNDVQKLDCNEKLFTQVVKLGFNQRRKTLRNSLKSLILSSPNEINKDSEIFSRRPETLSIQEFVELTKQFEV